MDEGSSTHEPGPEPLSEFIRRRHGTIAEDWVRLVAASQPEASVLPRPILTDVMPALLGCLADLLGARHDPGCLHKLPKLHALDRLERGFDLRALIAEYGLLRCCVLDRYEHERGSAPRTGDIRAFNRMIDDAIVQSVDFYVEQRARVLAALDRIAESSGGNLSLEALLDRLIGVFLETTRVADECTILLLGKDDRLHVRSSIGLDAEVREGWSVARDRGFAGRVASTRQPVALRDAASDPVVASPYLKAAGIHAVYGVPLEVGGALVGVAHMGSRTAYEFPEQDRALFRTLAVRAAIFIDQHMLREEGERRAAELEATFEQAAVGIAHVGLDGRCCASTRSSATSSATPARSCWRCVSRRLRIRTTSGPTSPTWRG